MKQLRSLYVWTYSSFSHYWKPEIPWSYRYLNEDRCSENTFLGHIVLMRLLVYRFFKFKILGMQEKDYEAVKLVRGLEKRYRLKYMKIVIPGQDRSILVNSSARKNCKFASCLYSCYKRQNFTKLQFEKHTLTCRGDSFQQWTITLVVIHYLFTLGSGYHENKLLSQRC